MGNMSLDDILITPLARIATTGGDVLHAMKQSDAGYNAFGEAYFSWVAAGSAKAWKRHTRMTMNVVVPVGMVKFVFCVEGSGAFRVEEIGVDCYARITVPPGIWFGFQGLSAPNSLVLNLADIPHDPNEVERMALSDINFDWK
ncbi:MAG: dTDP-4-dehydrorhamnose 3,5-epimerase [Rhodoferax sp.]|nr:dTDP-4-dehydrorhamnose 3,5-epimerase [Rhodoferax sp.]MDP3651349.1 dTDP-4-dehydrorhamnose 3,5-epimerase [Rhodoferax sp.]